MRGGNNRALWRGNQDPCFQWILLDWIYTPLLSLSLCLSPPLFGSPGHFCIWWKVPIDWHNTFELVDVGLSLSSAASNQERCSCNALAHLGVETEPSCACGVGLQNAWGEEFFLLPVHMPNCSRDEDHSDKTEGLGPFQLIHVFNIVHYLIKYRLPRLDNKDRNRCSRIYDQRSKRPAHGVLWKMRSFRRGNTTKDVD